MITEHAYETQCPDCGCRIKINVATGVSDPITQITFFFILCEDTTKQVALAPRRQDPGGEHRDQAA